MALFTEGKLFRKAGEGSGGGGGDQHNLGWYATQSALETAHPTATAGDWAIVGATDTVWIWDTDDSEWVDSDQKGQVTSVNGQTGAVTIATLPDQTGNAGKFLTTDGTDASWSDTIEDNKIIVKNTASSQYAYVDQITFYAKYNNSNGRASTIRTINSGGFEFSGDLQTQNIAAVSNGKNLGSSFRKWATVYTTKLNNGADITVPAVAGEMAVKQVNTTITLTAADWSSNTQTVNVTGMTATGVVFVSPDPTDQADYTSAGIICSAQAAGTLTFTCSTTPANDIDVVVVML